MRLVLALALALLGGSAGRAGDRAGQFALALVVGSAGGVGLAMLANRVDPVPIALAMLANRVGCWWR